MSISEIGSLFIYILANNLNKAIAKLSHWLEALGLIFKSAEKRPSILTETEYIEKLSYLGSKIYSRRYST